MLGNRGLGRAGGGGDPGPGPALGAAAEPLPGGCVALDEMPLPSSNWGPCSGPPATPGKALGPLKVF